MTDQLLTRRQVIARLNVSYDWFSRHRMDLEAKGFPKPLAAFGSHQGARWDPAAIDAWLAAQRPQDRGDSNEGGEPSDEELDALLEARGGRIAAGLDAAE